MIDAIKRAWRWSRTVFINVAAVVAVIAVELISYAVDIDWNEYLGEYYGGLVGIGFGVLNIVLRVWFTAGAVGEKGGE